MSNTSLSARVTHRFRAAPEAVFDAWLTGEKVRRWFAPGLGEMTRVAVDPRVGGSFLFAQRRGMDEVEHLGKYEELFRPDRLAFTWQVKGTADISRVVIDIAATADGCELTLVHQLHPHWANYVERTQSAWTKMLNAMAEAIG
jgi:uncharacterized protein YndB with AHSA1/START domain